MANLPTHSPLASQFAPDLPTVPEIARAVLAAGEDGPDRVPMAEVCRRLRLAHRSTAIRFVLRGVKALDGAVVKLPAVRLGRNWYTTAAALEAFVLRLNTPAAADAVPVRSPAQRRRASERAEERLKRLGC